jgi:hypothetical protein
MNVVSKSGAAGIPLMVGLVWLLMASYFGAMAYFGFKGEDGSVAAGLGALAVCLLAGWRAITMFVRVIRAAQVADAEPDA